MTQEKEPTTREQEPTTREQEPTREPSSDSSTGQRPAKRGHRTPGKAAGGAVMVIAVVLLALNLRPAVNSLGVVMPELQASTGLSGTVAGLLLALPTLCFAVVGFAASWLAARIGSHRTVLLSLVALVGGQLLRATVDGTWALFAGSILALAGVAIGNVLLPGLIRLHFPTAIAPMTAVYTTVLMVGQSVSAGVTLPIQHGLGGTWRLGIGMWTATAVVALVPWIVAVAGASQHGRTRPRRLGKSRAKGGRARGASAKTASARTATSKADGFDTGGLPTRGSLTDGLPTRGSQTDGLPTRGSQTDGLPTRGSQTDGLPTAAPPAARANPTGTAAVRSSKNSTDSSTDSSDIDTGVITLASLFRSRYAWAMAVFFGMQSLQAYVVFGWVPKVLTEAGMSQNGAGGILAVITAVGVPMSAMVPTVLARMRRPSLLVIAFCLSLTIGYTGLILIPTTGTWAQGLLIGFGLSAFPMCLTLMALRARTADGTTALSGFGQSVGYLLASVGPVGFGFLHDQTGSSTVPLIALICTLVPMLIGGLVAVRDWRIEDDVQPSR